MNPTPQSSFIPKQSKNSRQVNRRVRRVAFPVLSVLGYAFFIGALLSAGAVFVFEKYTEKQLQQTVAGLEGAIQNFSEADLRTVVGFSNRITTANSILNNHASITKVLDAVEQLALQTVTILSLELSREAENQIVLSFKIEAEEFDALLFQRDVLSVQGSDLIEKAQFSDVDYNPAQTGQEGGTEPKTVSFGMELTLPANKYLVKDSILQPEVEMDDLEIFEFNPISEEEIF